jgi:hypothetical protein
MSSFMMPKPPNYSPVFITDDYDLVANVYNAIFADIDFASTVTLPDLANVLGGFPVTIKNRGPDTLTVNNNNDTLLCVLSPGDTVNIIADTDLDQWQIMLGPTGSITGITGPGASTNNAIVLWNGAGGNAIKNSGVTITGTNVIGTAAGNLGLNAATSIIDCNNCTLINVDSIALDAQLTFTGSPVTVVGAVTTNILQFTTTLNTGFNATVSVVILNSTSAADTGSFNAKLKVKNIAGTASVILYDSAVTLDASLSGIAIDATVTGADVRITTSGKLAITTKYQAIVNGTTCAF